MNKIKLTQNYKAIILVTSSAFTQIGAMRKNILIMQQSHIYLLRKNIIHRKINIKYTNKTQQLEI